MKSSRNIQAIGTDICEVDRFRNMQMTDPFIVDAFTKQEIKDCEKKSNPHESLAARFAAKEAIQKCIDEQIRFHTIEIRNMDSGKPYVRFIDNDLENKYEIMLSISHSKNTAIAFCVSFNKGK